MEEKVGRVSTGMLSRRAFLQTGALFLMGSSIAACADEDCIPANNIPTTRERDGECYIQRQKQTEYGFIFCVIPLLTFLAIGSYMANEDKRHRIYTGSRPDDETGCTP